MKPEHSSEGLVRSDRHKVGAGFLWVHILLALGLLVAAGAAMVGLASSGTTAAAQGRNVPPPALAASHPLSAASGREAAAAYGRLPLIFEANQGQSDARVKFLARGSGYVLFLTGNEAVLTLQTVSSPQRSSAKPDVVRMHLAGSSATKVSAADELPGRTNYLIGNDPAKWHRNVPQYARVRYEHVYPGIDSATF
jgi:hypothetical protein